MSKNNGGPAFPYTEGEGNRAVEHQGMTLRDYFAAKALNGILASMAGDSIGKAIIEGATNCKIKPLRFVVDMAYQYADETLAARNE